MNGIKIIFHEVHPCIGERVRSPVIIVFGIFPERHVAVEVPFNAIRLVKIEHFGIIEIRHHSSIGNIRQQLGVQTIRIVETEEKVFGSVLVAVKKYIGQNALCADKASVERNVDAFHAGH